VLYYFPVLLIAGLLTGFLIGLLAQELIVRLRFLTEKYHE
jgi:heptaprenyl diphosphate synthase